MSHTAPATSLLLCEAFPPRSLSRKVSQGWDRKVFKTHTAYGSKHQRERERDRRRKKSLCHYWNPGNEDTHTHTHTHTPATTKKAQRRIMIYPRPHPLSNTPWLVDSRGDSEPAFLSSSFPLICFYTFSPQPQKGGNCEQKRRLFLVKLAGDTCGREEGERIFYFDLSNSSDIPQTGGGKRLSERRIFFPSSPRPSIFYFT